MSLFPAIYPVETLKVKIEWPAYTNRDAYLHDTDTTDERDLVESYIADYEAHVGSRRHPNILPRTNCQSFPTLWLNNHPP